MTEPTMKATPARKKSFSTMSTAAATLSTAPVIEIAFGVSRDSIRLSRVKSRSSCALRGRGRSRRRVRGGRSSMAIRKYSRHMLVATEPRQNARDRSRGSPGGVPRPVPRAIGGEQAVGDERGDARDQRTGGRVEPEVVG